MDPTALLSEIRSTVRELEDSVNEEGEYYPALVEHLMGKVSDLDEWMSRGGFSPLPWRN